MQGIHSTQAIEDSVVALVEELVCAEYTDNKDPDDLTDEEDKKRLAPDRVLAYVRGPKFEANLMQYLGLHYAARAARRKNDQVERDRYEYVSTLAKEQLVTHLKASKLWSRGLGTSRKDVLVDKLWALVKASRHARVNVFKSRPDLV